MAKKEKTMELDLNLIVFDEELQVRVETDQETVHDYYEAMQTEEDVKKFPPPTVYFDGCRYWLADGHHRYWAAKRRGFEKMTVKVIEGTHDDALLAAVKLNAKNGLRFNDGDKQKIVLLFLAKWPNDSNGAIAEKAVCTREYVRQLRPEPESSGGNNLPPEKRRGKDGKMYPVKAQKKMAKQNVSATEQAQAEETVTESTLPTPDATVASTSAQEVIEASVPETESDSPVESSESPKPFTEQECIAEEEGILNDLLILQTRINAYFDRAPGERHEGFAELLRASIDEMID